MPGMILVPLDVAAQQNFKMISHYIVLLFYTTSSNGKESACNAGDQGLIPGLGRSSGEGNGNPLQYSYLENFMDRGAWWATVCGVAKSWTRLSSSLAHTHTRTHTHILLLIVMIITDIAVTCVTPNSGICRAAALQNSRHEGLLLELAACQVLHGPGAQPGTVGSDFLTFVHFMVLCVLFHIPGFLSSSSDLC